MAKTTTTKVRRRSLFLRMLDTVERVGNALPHPATIFALLALSVAAISALASWAGVTAVHPGTGETIEVFNLLSPAGVRWMFEEVDANFVRFPPLGLVLVAMIGIGVAEGSGLLSVLIRALVLKAPARLITASVVFAGVVSHVASEAGYVILIPLGASIFLALGRHPLAGLAAAFAGVSCGFGANFLISSVDPVLAGLTESAARILDPGITVEPGGQPLLHGRIGRGHRGARHLDHRADRRAASRHRTPAARPRPRSKACRRPRSGVCSPRASRCWWSAGCS